MSKKVCPKCGSKRRTAETSTTKKEGGFDAMFAWPDWICKDCGTKYVLDRPALHKYSPILIGVGGTLMFTVMIIEPDWELTCFGYLGLLVCVAFIVYGVWKLFQPEVSRSGNATGLDAEQSLPDNRRAGESDE